MIAIKLPTISPTAPVPCCRQRPQKRPFQSLKMMKWSRMSLWPARQKATEALTLQITWTLLVQTLTKVDVSPHCNCSDANALFVAVPKILSHLLARSCICWSLTRLPTTYAALRQHHICSNRQESNSSSMGNVTATKCSANTPTVFFAFSA